MHLLAHIEKITMNIYNLKYYLTKGVISFRYYLYICRV